jgi:hypothetical protein
MMEIRKVKVTLLGMEGDNATTLPYPQATTITDAAGNTLIPYWPIDIHIDGEGSYVTLRMPAEVEVEGQVINEKTDEDLLRPIGWEAFKRAVIGAVKSARKERKL